jgi:hypothetical protein
MNIHRNACSVPWVGVGTRLANRKLVIGYFTVGTIFNQPLDGNGLFCNGEVLRKCQSFWRVTLRQRE